MNAYYPPVERAQMRTRLQALCGRPLTTEEAAELRTLAHWLDVRLEWTRHYLDGRPAKRLEYEEGVN